MSVAPPSSQARRRLYEEATIIDDTNDEHNIICGFVFAFFRYSQMVKSGFFETLVHLATRSDCIHVAILPAPIVHINEKNGNIECIKVHDITFTAFMGHGFEEQSAQTVMNDQYEYMFMQVPRPKYHEGLDFLISLKGSKYNYLDLPLTMLPFSMKQKNHFLDNKKTTKKPLQHHNYNYYDQCTPSRVFCSQVGLMLCYECDMIPNNSIDPSCCAPGELIQIVHEKAGGIRCDSSLIQIEHDLFCC